MMPQLSKVYLNQKLYVVESGTSGSQLKLTLGISQEMDLWLESRFGRDDLKLDDLPIIDLMDDDKLYVAPKVI